MSKLSKLVSNNAADLKSQQIHQFPLIKTSQSQSQLSSSIQSKVQVKKIKLHNQPMMHIQDQEIGLAGNQPLQSSYNFSTTDQATVNTQSAPSLPLVKKHSSSLDGKQRQQTQNAVFALNSTYSSSLTKLSLESQNHVGYKPKHRYDLPASYFTRNQAIPRKMLQGKTRDTNEQIQNQDIKLDPLQVRDTKTTQVDSLNVWHIEDVARHLTQNLQSSVSSTESQNSFSTSSLLQPLYKQRLKISKRKHLKEQFLEGVKKGDIVMGEDGRVKYQTEQRTSKQDFNSHPSDISDADRYIEDRIDRKKLEIKMWHKAVSLGIPINKTNKLSSKSSTRALNKQRGIDGVVKQVTFDNHVQGGDLKANQNKAYHELPSSQFITTQNRQMSASQRKDNQKNLMDTAIDSAQIITEGNDINSKNKNQKQAGIFKPEGDWQKDLVMEQALIKGLDLAVGQQMQEQFNINFISPNEMQDKQQKQKQPEKSSLMLRTTRDIVRKTKLHKIVNQFKNEDMKGQSKSNGVSARQYKNNMLNIDSKDNSQVQGREFLSHFTMVTLLTHKCLVLKSKHIRGRTYVLKELLQKHLELFQQSHIYNDIAKQKPKNQQLNDFEDAIYYYPMVQKLVELPTQMPLHNINICYGIVQIWNKFYIISDMVQDWQPLPSQISEADFDQLLFPIVQQPEKQVIKKSCNSTPKWHEDNMNQVKGLKLPERKVQQSSNMFELIMHMKMRDLQGMEKIPESYQWAILEYLVQASKTFAYAHSHDIVHGNFCLSKALIQVTPYNSSSLNYLQEMKFDFKGNMNQQKSPQNLYFAINEPNIASHLRYTIVLINFDPMKVQSIIDQNSDSDFLKVFQKKLNLTLSHSHYLKIAKIQDLQQFGCSLLDLLQGKYLEGAQQFGEKHTFMKASIRADKRKSLLKTQGASQIDKDVVQLDLTTGPQNQLSEQAKQKESGREGQPQSINSKSSIDQIFVRTPPIDQIPLKWCKLPICNDFIEILRLCIGPFNTKERFQEIDTVQVFKKIHDIAGQRLKSLLQKHFDKSTVSKLTLKQIQFNHNLCQQEIDRLRSAAINNFVTLMMFTVSNAQQFTVQSKKQRMLNFLKMQINRACKLDKNNHIVRLNRKLFQWCNGDICDDQITVYIQDTLYKHDQAAALLFYMIFKRIALGEDIPCKEKDYLMSHVYAQNSNLSNFAKYLLYDDIIFSGDDQHDSPENKCHPFIKQQTICHSEQGSTIQHIANGVITKSKAPDCSQLLQVNQEKPKSIFFSDNDHYVVLITDKNAQIYHASDAKMILSRPLPRAENISKDQIQELKKFRMKDTRLNNQRGPQISSDDEGLNLIEQQSSEESSQQILTSSLAESNRHISKLSTAQDQFTNQTVQANKKQTQREYSHMRIETADYAMGSSLESNLVDQTDVESSQKQASKNQYFKLETQKHQSNNELNKLMSNNILNEQSYDPSQDIEDTYGSSIEMDSNSGINRIDDEANQVAKKQNKSIIPQMFLKNIEQLANGNNQLKQIIQQEQEELLKQYPPDWKAHISNNGHRLALYDSNQLLRVQNSEFLKHEQELLFIYDLNKPVQNIMHSNQLQNNGNSLDASQLNYICISLWDALDGQELLDFGFNDVIGGQASNYVITLQSKDLKLHTIDLTHMSLKYIKPYLIKQYDSQLKGQVLRKSIFNGSTQNYRSVMYTQQLKQFIQYHEQLGNKVLIPKINQKILAVNSQNSDLVTFYTYDKLEKFRMIRLKKFGTYFKQMDIEIDDLNQRYVESANETIDTNEKELILTPQSQNRILQKNKQMDQQNCQISLIEISPQGRAIVALVDGQMLIRIVATTQRFEEYEQDAEEISQVCKLLPIFQNLDYIRVPEVVSNKKINLEVVPSEILLKSQDFNSNANNSQIAMQNMLGNISVGQDQSQSFQNLEVNAINDANDCSSDQEQNGQLILKLCPKFVESGFQLFYHSRQTPFHQALRHERVVELNQFMSKICMNPQLLLECNIKPKDKIERINACYEMMRSFGQLRPKQIIVTAFKDIKRLCIFDKFQVKRSDEKLYSIACGSLMGPTLIAALVGRFLHVYEIPSCKLLFKQHLPNAVQFCSPNLMKQYAVPFQFLDNDQLLVYQIESQSIVFISVSIQTEQFSKLQHKQVNQEVTFKVEKPLSEYIQNINNFQIPREGQSHDCSFDNADADNDNGADDGNLDGGPSGSKALKKQVNFDFDVQAIFATDSIAPLSYMAVIGKHRLVVFEVQEDLAKTAEITMIIEKDYRNDKKLKQMGQITCVAFENQYCGGFVSISQLGWLCLWHFESKSIISKVQIDTKKIEIRDCTCMRFLNNQNKIFLYYPNQEQLLQIEIESSETKQNDDDSQPKQNQAQNQQKQQQAQQQQNNQDLSEEDRQIERLQKNRKLNIVNKLQVLKELQHKQSGKVMRMIEDQVLKQYLFIVTNLQVILLYDMQTEAIIRRIEPQLSPQAQESFQVCIDDFCSFTAGLHGNGNQVEFNMITWKYRLYKEPLPYQMKYTDSHRTKKSTCKLLSSQNGKGQIQQKLQKKNKKRDPLTQELIDSDSDTQKSKACTIF